MIFAMIFPISYAMIFYFEQLCITKIIKCITCYDIANAYIQTIACTVCMKVTIKNGIICNHHNGSLSGIVKWYRKVVSE